MYNPNRMKVYDNAFKDHAACLVLDTELSISAVSKKLGIPRTTLNKWVVKMYDTRRQQLVVEEYAASATKSDTAERLDRMERELGLLRAAVNRIASGRVPTLKGVV